MKAFAIGLDKAPRLSNRMESEIYWISFGKLLVSAFDIGVVTNSWNAVDFLARTDFFIVEGF